MISPARICSTFLASVIALHATSGFAQTAPATAPADGPYKVVNTVQYMGTGGLDYVTADSDGRRLYIYRGKPEVQVYDLDTFKPVGVIPLAGRAHGAVVDPVSGHVFCSSKPITMADSKTLAVLKTIDVQGSPDGMLFDPFNEHVYVLSHQQPYATVIDAKDGTVLGTIDLGGGPEQAQSDGQGHIYIDIEDQDNVAVVDAKTMQVTAHYDVSSKAGGPGGLGLDAKNHILFAMCSDPATCVVLSATDGKILAAIPIHPGTDGGGFNPATMEAFSSQGDGSLSIIKENSPTDFVLEQTVTTKQGAKCSTLDTKTNHIILTTTERAPAAAPAAASSMAAPAAAPAMASSSAAPSAPTMAAAPAASAPAASGQRGGRRGGNNGPSLLDIIVVGK